MQPRVMGSEDEYALQFCPDLTTPSSRKAMGSADTFAHFGRALSQLGLPWAPEQQNGQSGVPVWLLETSAAEHKGLVTHSFLVNGARFYQDTGAHGEYAGPECASPADVVRYGKAGERTLESLAELAEEYLEVLGRFVAIKNNVDLRGNTYGSHESYLLPRTIRELNKDRTWNLFTKYLTPFLATRHILVGGGKSFGKDGKPGFQISQRADFIESELTSSTTANRSIINLRDEPLSTEEKYRRLHLIVGDANMSERAGWLKFGMTDIVLELIERGLIDFDFSLDNPVRTISETSHDLGFKVPLKNGAFTTACEIQKYYLQAAQRQRSLFDDPEHQELLQIWEQELHALQHDSFNPRLDWTLRKTLQERYLRKKGSDFITLQRWYPLIRFVKEARIETDITQLLTLKRESDTESLLASKLDRKGVHTYQSLLRAQSISKAELLHLPRSCVIYNGLVQRDLQFNNVNRKEGLFYVSRFAGTVPSSERLVPGLTETSILYAQQHAPQNTRAYLRGQAIRKAFESGARLVANWQSVSLVEGKHYCRSIKLPDPFETDNADLSDLLKNVAV